MAEEQFNQEGLEMLALLLVQTIAGLERSGALPTAEADAVFDRTALICRHFDQMPGSIPLRESSLGPYRSYLESLRQK